MNAIKSIVDSLAVDVVGLGFAAAALFLVFTGHVGEPGFGVSVGIAGAYLGLKVPTA